MALKKFKEVSGKGVFVPGDDIDTDRIIPARFMKCVTFEGLGQYTFYDVRFDETGKSKNHPLDRPEHKGAQILLSGANFGCGSSREHAPQALFHFGIRGIIALSYAEIFFGNCITLGIPCVTVSKPDTQLIGQIIEQKPESEIAIDLENKQVKIAGQTFACDIPENARGSLLEGQWDSLGDLLEGTKDVEKTLESLPYANSWAS
jgi:3-isopropylmalate/(R)-2-methylmalate dehydratase small subunit